MAFLMKRGHLSTVAMGRKMFARVPPMTPARFDLLHVVFERSRMRRLPGQVIAQAEVRKRLGLHRQTVSEMVVRLVELGWIEKLYDRRRVILRLTAEGARRIRLAYGVAFTERPPLPPEIPLGQPETRIAYRVVEDESKAAYASLVSEVDPFFARCVTQATPPNVGREVAKAFTAFAWSRTYGGRRGRRMRHLHQLDDMISEAHALARVLGDDSDLIYRLDYEVDH